MIGRIRRWRAAIGAVALALALATNGAERAADSAPKPAQKPPDASAVQSLVLYVAPEGKAKWSGRLAHPTADGTDGPLPSLASALAAARQVRAHIPSRWALRIVVADGVYTLPQTLTIGPSDGGRAGYLKEELAGSDRVEFVAAHGAHPVLSGGRRITGFRPATVNGVAVWEADLSAPDYPVDWNFRELWVNGQRRPRTRLPETGYYRVAGSGDLTSSNFTGEPGAPRDRFSFAAGNLSDDWYDLPSVEINVINYWMHQRLPIRSIDAAQRQVVLADKCRCSFRDARSDLGARYYVENVVSALRLPGQWYLDRPAHKLYYIPRPGETPKTTEVVAPYLHELVHIDGTAQQRVAEVHMAGLTFAFVEPVASYDADNALPGAWRQTGAVQFSDAEGCSLDHCRFDHVGGYGVECTGNCLDIALTADTITDTGAGGVKFWSGCDRCTVADSDIGPGDEFNHAGIGVLVGQCSGTQIVHNRIHGFDNIGIGVGRAWGFGASTCYGNVIEYNDIADIGRGVLSDLAGIHTLGPQVGTRIRYNRIERVSIHSYGGWGIYLDEGSSGILVEGNLCAHCQTGGFFQHIGSGNDILNNIFVCDDGSEELRLPTAPHASYRFQRNIVAIENTDVFEGAWKNTHAQLQKNLYFSSTGKPLRFCGLDFAAWQAAGFDQGSVVEDAGFVDPAHGDYRLKNPTVAAAIGITPLDLSTVGPRSDVPAGASAGPAE
ncbi:MAG: right-handed parallel beta-helix repeat-containing protein [Planctomycetota bacterium]